MSTNKSQTEQLPQDAVMQSVLDAKELRIGNFVYCKIYDKQIKMESFFGLCNIESRPDLFEPIALTEEWLIKLGFTWSIAHQGFFKKDFYYVIDFYETYPKVEGCIAFLNKNHRNGEKLLSVKYVHQLQNLYFALTQSELTVA